jgi:hypothetical protein
LSTPSTANRIARLERRITERWIDALLVVQSHDGAELLRVGGCWDRELGRYDHERAATPHVVVLQESQQAVGAELAEWRDACDRGDLGRILLLIAGGNRGSGKTWVLAGVALVAVALQWPGCWQFGVNLTAKQRRECLESVRAVARPEWIKRNSDSARNPETEFLTGSVVQWLSSGNPRALRQAGLPIRHVFINEGQDQPERVFTNAISAIRNQGGLVSVATNPPQFAVGNWVAKLWMAIDAGELPRGRRHYLDNRLNRAVDQDALRGIADFLRAVNGKAAEADADGIFALAGPTAYPAFSPLPAERGGHLGEPPPHWRDVTRECSADAVDGEEGFDFVAGVDFQRQPGIIGTIGKLYRDERGELVLWICDVVGVQGVEADFSGAMVASGYAPVPGMVDDRGNAMPTVLLVGDGTGARQNAEHRFAQPPSFMALRADGWTTVPPMYHWKRRTPWNPLVSHSRAQMHAVLGRHQLLFSTKCRQSATGFPSLTESFTSAQVTERGRLIELGHYQHGPDGVRYLAWRFLPRPQPPSPAAMVDASVTNELRSIRILEER